MRNIYLRGAEPPKSPRIFRKRLRPARDIGPGEIVAFRMDDERFVGRGFYNPRSVIAGRVLDRDEDGPPIDKRWFARRISAAMERRASLGLASVTDCWRVVHAEGDGLSGLVIDRYGDLFVVEVGCRGMFEHLHEIEEALPGRVVVRADRRVEEIEGFSVHDPRAAPARTIVTEHGLRYHVDAYGGHKTGFFLDQREARARVMELAAGKSVLDCCCYTGGFALAAAKGGAGAVTAVDLDEWAIAQGKENAALNEFAAEVEFVHADAFDFLRGGPVADLVILDPPKLARTRRELPRARRKSVDLNRLAARAVAPGGFLFTFSCTGLFSEEEYLRQVREAAGGGISVVEVTGQPADHPVAADCPESRYLTGVLLTLP